MAKEKGNLDKQIYVFYTFFSQEIKEFERVAVTSEFVVRIIPTIFDSESKSYIMDFSELEKCIEKDLESQDYKPLIVAANTLVLG